MSAYCVTRDLASVIKTSKDTISIRPQNQYRGTELDDDKLDKLYAMYCGLMLMQYEEDCKKYGRLAKN